MKQHPYFAVLTTMLVLSWSSGVPLLGAELEQPEGFEPTELIETLEFTIRVGEQAEALAEPVGLDLGLGFPFWLHPLGAEQTDRLTIGAVPQEAPEQVALQPGATATFIFRRTGDAGNDRLHYTPQLLDGVRISDITRLGILSKGKGNWELGGYRLVINGRAFAAHHDIGRLAQTEVERAALEWVAGRERLAGISAEKNDLAALEEAGLATEQDLSRLQEIQEEIRPLQARVTWQQGVASGALPWFLEEELQIPGREATSEIATARVIVTTSPQHTNAETYNYVYFRTGGKKYFLYPADNHFTSAAGPQAFDLYLPAGPLAASDVRSFSVGMLAHDQPYVAAPDRWHPERLVVELDGLPVFDSDQRAIDRQSYAHAWLPATCYRGLNQQRRQAGCVAELPGIL